jgi:acyl-CoA synthetase (AMP-forming)/AMP-acid ligase II
VIFRSPEPDIVIPEVALTPFLLERAAARRDKPAFIDGPTGRTLTYAGLVEAVHGTAAGLAARGFRQGNVLAIYSPNLPEYAVAFHAVSLLGGIVTTINPSCTPAELSLQLSDAGAMALVTVPACLDKASHAARDAGVGEVFVFPEAHSAADGAASGATPFASLLTHGGTPPPVEIDPRAQVVALPYSSGTTGLPKGVMLTHYNLVANILQSACGLNIDEHDTLLGVLPFFHIYGMVVIMNLGLHMGATIVTMPRFDMEPCLQIMQQYRVTFANVVPPIVLGLAKHPLVDKYDLRHLHTVFSGAAPLSEHVAAAASARLGCRVVQGYGLTETSPVTHATRITPGTERIKTAGIGPPIANTEARVVDVTTGAELGPQQHGEICVRGPQVMKGYLNRPDATAAMIDPEGWLHTGDIGFADDDGCFFIVDRLKELIKYKGMQVAPAELEAVLLSHPSIADAAVIPIADEACGEVPKAFVVLKATVAPEEISNFVAERVAPYKRLRAVETIDQIPKSPSGKILRRVLIERERARTSS